MFFFLFDITQIISLTTSSSPFFFSFLCLNSFWFNIHASSILCSCLSFLFYATPLFAISDGTLVPLFMNDVYDFILPHHAVSMPSFFYLYCTALSDSVLFGLGLEAFSRGVTVAILDCIT